MKINWNFIFSSVVVAILLCNVSPSFATPGSSSNLRLEHLDAAADLSRWSFGAYGLGRERNAGFNDIKHTKYMGYIGYDLLRWMTPYITFGESKTKVGIEEYGDWEPEYGVGVNLFLLDHIIPDPLLMEDRIRINAGCEYTLTETSGPRDDADWGELFAHLTFGLINDIDGTKVLLPNSIGVYGGVIASMVHGDSLIDDGDEVGYTVGVDVYITESISLEASMEVLDEVDFAGGLHVRF